MSFQTTRLAITSLAGTPFKDDLESAFDKLGSGLTPHMQAFLDQLPRVVATKADPARRRMDDATPAQAPLVGRALDLRTASATTDLARAEGLVGEALAASPRSAYSHLVKGQLLRAQNRWEEAIPEYETALALDHNSVGALHGLAQCKLFTGAIEETIPLEEQAIRLSPRDPVIGNRYGVIGTVHLLQSRADEAILWLEKARSALPGTPVAHAYLASAYALRGETERAAAELAKARKLAGDDRYSSLAGLKAFGEGRWGVPKTRGLWEATYFVGLRKAGLPEK